MKTVYHEVLRVSEEELHSFAASESAEKPGVPKYYCASVGRYLLLYPPMDADNCRLYVSKEKDE